MIRVVHIIMRLLIVVTAAMAAALTAPIDRELSENEIVFLPNVLHVNVSDTNSSQDKVKSTAYYKENVDVLNSRENNIELTALAIEKHHALNILDAAFDNIAKLETDDYTHVTENYFRVQPKHSVTDMEVMEAFDRNSQEMTMTGPSNRELNVACNISTTIVPNTAATDFGTSETSELDAVVSSNLDIAEKTDFITTVFDNFTTMASDFVITTTSEFETFPSSDIDTVKAIYIDRSVTSGLAKTTMSDIKTAGLSDLNMGEKVDIETRIKSDINKTDAAHIRITTATDSDTTATSDFDTAPSGVEIPVSTDTSIALATDTEISMRSFSETTVATDIATIVTADVDKTLTSAFGTTVTSDCNTTSTWNKEITWLTDNGSSIDSNNGTNIVADLSTPTAAHTGTALVTDIETTLLSNINSTLDSDIDTTLDTDIVISIMTDIERHNATTEHIRLMPRYHEKPLKSKKKEPKTEAFMVAGSNITNVQESLPEIPKPDEYNGNYINSLHKEIPKHTQRSLLTEDANVLEISIAKNKPRFDLENLLVADLEERSLDIVKILDTSVELDSNYDLNNILLDNFDDVLFDFGENINSNNDRNTGSQINNFITSGKHAKNKDEIKFSNDVLSVDTGLEFNDINMIIGDLVDHDDFPKRDDDLDIFDFFDEPEKVKQYVDVLINDNINKISQNTVIDYDSNMNEHSASLASDDSTVFIYLEGLELANVLSTLVTEEERTSTPHPTRRSRNKQRAL